MNTHTNNQNGALAIRRGRINRPQKAVIYGPEGVGKSTFASLTPDPVFLDTEGGTHHLDVTRLDAAATWDEITASVAQLAKADHPFKTLVIDTADWLEKRLSEHLCRKANKDSIEDFGYGKGWVQLTEEFARFLNSLDALLARGMNVVFLAHATVRKFEAPDQAGSYDRFELKLSKQTAPLLKEWADLVLFANYVTKIAEKDNGKVRGVGGKERVLFATHTAAYDAKNRHGLPDKLPFAIDSLAPVFGATAVSPTQAAAAPAKSLADRISETFQPLADMANVVGFLVERGKLAYTAEGPVESIDNLDPAYAARMLADPKRFVATVNEWVKGKEATK
ncbi:MAG: ATP-binding protein [Verrucomicrobia bacterium]|nr:ATP-binding protein [Verrucomicrobiota bacterium]